MNVPRIQRMRRLDSAATLLQQARRAGELQTRRTSMLEIRIGRDSVSIRDQMPLKVNALTITDGASLGEFVAYLNHHVYFWPGDDDGPVCASGRNHFLRYESENPAIIRIETRQLLDTNKGNPPLFSHCNSGSARYHGGKRAPRNRKMFVGADDFGRRPSQVIEVTFRDGIILPAAGVHLRRLAAKRWQAMV